MPSQKLASGENLLKGELAAAWNILEGSSGDYTDLGIARRFGGAAAAYSLRDIGAMNGSVVRVRREPNDTTAGIDDEERFSANQVQDGTLEKWVNGELESTLPADVATAAAAYSLRKVKASYSGDAVRIRRSSDDIEVDVAFDSDGKVSASSAITNVAEQGGESGSTSATDLNGFLNESTENFSAIAYAGIDASYKNFTSDPTISETAFSGTNGGTASRLCYSLPLQLTISEADGCKFKVTGTIDSLSGGNVTIKPTTQNNGAGSYTPAEGNKVISDGTTGAFEYIFTGNGVNEFKSVIFIIDASTTVSASNLKFEIIEHGATVHTWYDQAGSNDAVQGTAANQPTIAENGALLADGLLFDGSNDVLVSTSFSATQPITTSAVFKSSNTSDSQTVIGGTTYNYIIHRAGGAATAGLNTGTLYAPFSSITTKQLMTTLANGASSTVSQNGVISSTGNAGTGDQTDLGIGSNGNGGTAGSGSAKFDGSIEEVIVYDSDQTNNRFKIESNINNYYGLYNDANDLAGNFTVDSSGTGTDASISNESKTGFTATVVDKAGFFGADLNESVPNSSNLYISFTANLSPSGGTAATPNFGLANSSDKTGNSTGNPLDTAVVEGFNSITVAGTASTCDRIRFSGNGRDMIQTTAGNQPSIVANGGYMGGVYSERSSNSTTSSNKQYMRITGTNSFASNDLTTTKVGMVAIVNSLLPSTASGISISTVLGNIRGVQSFPTGALGLQISGATAMKFTNYTATNAENQDSSSSTRTVGENTLIGGTMDNRNIKTFTFTEQGSDTDTTTASTDIVLTSQKDFGIFYSTFANDSAGEDLNATRAAGGYMKEAYILDGDIIDDIDAINLELRQHYNLA